MAESANITRRSVFRGLPLAAVAATGGFLTRDFMTTRERLDAAVAELQAAAQAHYPHIAQWTVNTDGAHTCPIVMAAFDKRI